MNVVDPDGRFAFLPFIYIWAAAVAASPDLQMDINELAMDISAGDYGSAALDVVGIAVPAMPATGIKASARGIKMTAETMQRIRDGRKFETAVISALGATKNTERVIGASSRGIGKDHSGHPLERGDRDQGFEGNAVLRQSDSEAGGLCVRAMAFPTTWS
ncbi:MAG: hypothetical protein MZV49_09200 [Rhodopseudomonas palustris]|nr:hypothetical protein [Rhodopseudomonas palustris]